MAKEDLLRSWKDISSYLEVNARTCRRWEKDLGLPVHRIHAHSARSPVFAYASELDLWLAGKSVSSLNREEIKSPLPRLRVISWVMAAATVLLASASFFKFVPISHSKSDPESLSIAVMPIKNLNASPQDEYFSEGITQEIINDLAFYNNVQVFPAIDHPDSKKGAGQRQQIRSSLGVDYILKGSLQRSKGMIHLDVEIIRLRDNQRILNLRLDEDLAKPFTIVNSLCQKISETLRLNQEPYQRASQFYPLEKTYTADVYDTYIKGRYILDKLNNGQEEDAWKLYHQGKFYWGQSSRENNELAIQLFSQALTLDSSFAQAYIGLAYCYKNYVNFGWDYQAKWLDKAETLLNKAHDLSPDLPEYFSALAEIYLIKDVGFGADMKREAFKLVEEGIRRYPNHPMINSILGLCYFINFGENGKEEDFQKALEYKEKSYSINPYPFNNFIYTELLILNRQFEKAIAICDLLEQRTSNNIVRFRHGEICYYMGDLEKCKTIMEEFESPPSLKIGALFFLGMIAAQQGDSHKAEKIIRDINLLAPDDELGLGSDLLQMASIYIALGEKEKAYRYLDVYLSLPVPKKMPYVYKKFIDIDKNFDSCREESGFCQIFKRGQNKWPKAKRFESLQISKNASKS